MEIYMSYDVMIFHIGYYPDKYIAKDPTKLSDLPNIRYNQNLFMRGDG
jgi:hypothetical protein